MIWRCGEDDFDDIWSIINDGAQAYRGVIPDDCCAEPYMSREKLRHEMNDGVAFWGYDDEDQLVGVMGIQEVQDVTLIRHAYVRTESQKQGIGAQLLEHLLKLATDSGAGGNMGGRGVGDPVLREIWFSAGEPGGEEPPAQAVLDASLIGRSKHRWYLRMPRGATVGR